MSEAARASIVVVVAIGGIWALHALLASRSSAEATTPTLTTASGQPLSGSAGNVMGNW